jgi:hypothetical protein
LEARPHLRAIPVDTYLESAEEERSAAARTSTPSSWSGIVAAGRAARTAADGGAWRIGQLAMLVERHYRSGALRRFAEEIGEAYSSVRRYFWVVGRYPAEARARFSSLSFSHFQVVAGMSDRLNWLQRAERGHWSVERTVRESRGAKGIPTRSLATLQRPIESLARRLADLHEADGRALSKVERQTLARALTQLGAEVERALARLRSDPRSSEAEIDRMLLGAAKANGNGRPRTNGHARAKANGNGFRRAREHARR